MSEDKELLEVWKKQFEEFCEKERISTKISPDGEMYAFSSTACLWGGWIAAKRSQPVVELPKDCHVNSSTIFRNGFQSALMAVKQNLTAAGIKYTIGE